MGKAIFSIKNIIPILFIVLIGAVEVSTGQDRYPRPDPDAPYKAAIEAHRKGLLTVTVTDKTSKPLQGMKVKWRLAERQFRFGWFSNLYNPAVAAKMQEAGCDFTTMHFNWQATEPREGVFVWKKIDFRSNPEGYHNSGLLVKAHALVWLKENISPDYLSSKNFSEMKEAVEKHVTTLVKRYRGYVDIWNVINEPSASWSNLYGYSNAQIIELIKVACAVVRKEDPTAKIIINNASPVVEFYEDKQSPLDFLRECKARGVDYDIIGLQCYYDPYHARHGQQPVSIQTLRDMVDAYAKLGKEIHITEISVPSQPIEGRSGWTPELQAYWLEQTYKSFFSKPSVRAITWWNATDRNSFVTFGGLITSDGKNKLSYQVLKNLLTKNWFSKGKGVTDSKGRLKIRGFGGSYDITVTDPKSGLSTNVRMLVNEGRERSAAFAFDPSKIEKENEKTNAKLDTKIEDRLNWLDGLIEYWEGKGNAKYVKKGNKGKSAVESLRKKGKYERALKKIEAVLDSISVEKRTVLKAEKMELVEGKVADLSNGIAALYSAAALSETLELTSRKATVTVRASGDFAVGLAPLFVLSIGDSHSEEIFLDEQNWRNYSISMLYEPGKHEIRLLFPNDYQDVRNGEDRNLYVDTITITEKSWAPP